MRRYKLLLLIIAASLGLSAGCGSETTGDTLNRERDRQRELAALVTRDYDSMAGHYQGTLGERDVVLDLKLSKKSQDSGSSVPQPTLTGTLTFVPRVSIGAGDSRLRDDRQLDNGTYDKASSTLSLTVRPDGSIMDCRVKGGNTLECGLLLEASKVEFTVTRSDATAHALNVASADQTGTTYVGYDGESNIEAVFDSVLVSDGGAVHAGIRGRFVFCARSEAQPGCRCTAEEKEKNPSCHDGMQGEAFPFSDGHYHAGANSVVASIDGFTYKINVDCAIKSQDQLLCRWNARYFEEFLLTRSAVQAPTADPKAKDARNWRRI